jgi:hypothetical protein
VQSAELPAPLRRRTGWGDTHIIALKGSQVRIQEWSRQRQTVTGVVREFGRQPTSVAITVLTTSLRELTRFSTPAFWRNTTVVKKSPSSEVICTGTCSAPIPPPPSKGDGSARSCSVWRECSDPAIHLRVTRGRVEGHGRGAWGSSKRPSRMRIPSILSHRVDSPVEIAIHLMRETTMIKNIQAIQDHCASWDVSEVKWEAAMMSMLERKVVCGRRPTG